MYDPASEGFSASLCAIDRCQVGLLRALATRYSARLYLKGGMAMRALFGSLRLTRDIDFERDPSLSNDSLRKALPAALRAAALASTLQAPGVSITKDTPTTLRASLAATLKETGEPVHFEVEISGRGLPPPEYLVRLNLVPPIDGYITNDFEPKDKPHFGIDLAADENAIADYSLIFLFICCVVTGDGTAADVNVLTDCGIAEIS